MDPQRPIVLVTGGSRGIGAATACAAAELGYAVCVNYRERADKAREVVDAIEGRGGRAIAVQADVSNDSDVTRLFAEVDERLGTVTALVNNAGVMPAESRVDAMTLETLDSLWRMNISSAFMCAREAVRRMSRLYGGHGGTIINVSSIAAKRGGRSHRTHYAASKAALTGLTLGLALEVATEGIRVNAVLPGVTETDLHLPYGGQERTKRLAATVPIGRAATAQDVANVIAFLISDNAAYVTAALIEIAGGLT